MAVLAAMLPSLAPPQPEQNRARVRVAPNSAPNAQLHLISSETTRLATQSPCPFNRSRPPASAMVPRGRDERLRLRCL
eukprot:842628-Pyramimonas_sp.AAC.1